MYYRSLVILMISFSSVDNFEVIILGFLSPHHKLSKEPDLAPYVPAPLEPMATSFACSCPGPGSRDHCWRCCKFSPKRCSNVLPLNCHLATELYWKYFSCLQILHCFECHLANELYWKCFSCLQISQSF